MTFIIVEPAAGARLLSTFSTNTPLCSSKGAVAAGQRPTGYSTSSIHQACADAAGADSLSGALEPLGASDTMVYAPDPAAVARPFHISAPGADPTYTL